MRQRLEDRDHFMPASLLTSQIDTLEVLEVLEFGLSVDVELPVGDIVARVTQTLKRNDSGLNWWSLSTAGSDWKRPSDLRKRCFGIVG